MSEIAFLILLIFTSVGSKTSSHTHAVQARVEKITQSSTCERAPPFLRSSSDRKNLFLQSYAIKAIEAKTTHHL